MLIGHHDQQRDFLDAMGDGRGHHAWLLAGPRGLGKAAFALAAATHRLAAAAGPGEGIAADRLHVHPEHRVARLMRAPEEVGEKRPHPDFRLLERELNDKGDKLRAQIVIDQVRAFQELFRSRPSFSDWRVAVIDPVDDLRGEAANALLKTLEEPPPKSLLLLVSHSPGRLLPTIRSRVRTLRFQPLAHADVDAVLAAERPDLDPAERARLIALSGGSPGRALRFAGLDIAALEAALDALPGPGATGRALDLSRGLAGKAAQPRYEAFLELAPSRLADAAKRCSGPALHRALDRWERGHRLAADALPLQLETQAVVFELANMIGEA